MLSETQRINSHHDSSRECSEQSKNDSLRECLEMRENTTQGRSERSFGGGEGGGGRATVRYHFGGGQGGGSRATIR